MFKILCLVSPCSLALTSCWSGQVDPRLTSPQWRRELTWAPWGLGPGGPWCHHGGGCPNTIIGHQYFEGTDTKCSSDVDQQIKSDLNMLFQSWVHVDRVLFDVVHNRAVWDIVILARSPIPTEEEEDHDDHKRHEGGAADEGQDGRHVTLSHYILTLSRPVQLQFWLDLSIHSTITQSDFRILVVKVLGVMHKIQRCDIVTQVW